MKKIGLLHKIYINGDMSHGQSFRTPNCPFMTTSLNPMPNAHVCVYLMVHITKSQLQATFPKPLYIPHC